jgi:exosortase/archaeosortase
MSKQHIIARVVVFLFGLGVGLYSIRLLIGQENVTMYDQQSFSLLALIFVLLVALYLIALTLRPRLVPTNRRALAVIGLVLIYFAHTTLLDTPEKSIYLRDIIKILGAFLAITGPMKLLVTKETEEAKFMEDVEIIEV